MDDNINENNNNSQFFISMTVSIGMIIKFISITKTNDVD